MDRVSSSLITSFPYDIQEHLRLKSTGCNTVLVLLMFTLTASSTAQTWSYRLDCVQERLELKYKFTIQYEDPDFRNALCNLADISNLPERATLKIFLVFMTLDPIPSSSQGELVHSDQLSDQSWSTALKKEWPENFEIPRFSVNVEHRLRLGNAAFLNIGKHLDVGRDLKHDILEGLAGTMYTYKEYPSEDNLNQVAEALIKNHPCLTEPGSSTGWIVGLKSLKFKMAKMRKHGCSDIALK